MYVGNVNTTHDYAGEAQDCCLVAVWFSATKEDVPVSPTCVRIFVPAYSCPLTFARVFSSSFA